jgi:hypothetical protein
MIVDHRALSLTVSPLLHLWSCCSNMYICANIVEEAPVSIVGLEMPLRWRQQVCYVGTCLLNCAALHTKGCEEFPVHYKRAGDVLVYFQLHVPLRLHSYVIP